MKFNITVLLISIKIILASSVKVSDLPIDIFTWQCVRHTSPICLNGGVCIDWAFVGKHVESCICDDGYFGEHCEYRDEFAVKVRSKNRQSRLKRMSHSKRQRKSRVDWIKLY